MAASEGEDFLMRLMLWDSTERGPPVTAYANVFQKTFHTHWYAQCAYQRVRNASFMENLKCVLYEWFENT